MTFDPIRRCYRSREARPVRFLIWYSVAGIMAVASALWIGARL
jgi:hypothetical protein